MSGFRTLKVDQGRIDGLWVVGFHGEVDATRTPARRGAVYVDDDNHVCLLDEANEHRAVIDTSTVEVVAGSNDDIYMVAAALQRSGYNRRRWDELLREGARDAAPEARDAGVQQALIRLERGGDSAPRITTTMPDARPTTPQRQSLRARYLVVNPAFSVPRAA